MLKVNDPSTQQNLLIDMSHVMRKSVYAICGEQQKSQISTLFVHCLDSIILLVSISEI